MLGFPEFEDIHRWCRDNIGKERLEAELRRGMAYWIQSKVDCDCIIPQLAVWNIPDSPDEKMSVVLFIIAMQEWNDNRYDVMENLGKKCVADGYFPGMAFLLSEAWMRMFTEEEKAESDRLGRKVSEYPDKRECMILVGRSLIGPEGLSFAEIKRSRKGTISGYENPEYTFNIDPRSGLRSDLMNAFWQGASGAIMAKFDANN